MSSPLGMKRGDRDDDDNEEEPAQLRRRHAVQDVVDVIHITSEDELVVASECILCVDSPATGFTNAGGHCVRCQKGFEALV